MGKIGIVGGTFDPIHNGHLLLGKQAYIEYKLDAVWYMPSGQPPHKKDHTITAAKDRCAMVELAVEGEPYYRFSDFEVSRPGNTYTAQTIRLLREHYPEHEFYFILGADSLYEIEKWYHPEEVIGHVVILVAGRDYDEAHLPMEQQIAYLSDRYHGTIYPLHCVEVDISSEELRGMIARGKSVVKYVPKAVACYIEDHRLYQEDHREDRNDG